MSVIIPRKDIVDGENESIKCEETIELENTTPCSHPTTTVKVEHHDVLKVFLAILFHLFADSVTSFTVVLVDNGVPDRKRHPPLPDKILDQIAFSRYGLGHGELSISFLSLVLAIIIVFHTYRLVIIRRILVLHATVLLFRCLTMWITRLSVPYNELICHPDRQAALYKEVVESFTVLTSLGMERNGFSSCGDYMFSGHTAILSILNFFINEYLWTDAIWPRILTWLSCLLGMFFVLSSHQHYSIDVIIAFYIAFSMCYYYHSFTNHLHSRNSVQFGNPANFRFHPFYLFESDSNGKIPNECECPSFLSSTIEWLLCQKERLSSSEKEGVSSVLTSLPLYCVEVDKERKRKP